MAAAETGLQKSCMLVFQLLLWQPPEGKVQIRYSREWMNDAEGVIPVLERRTDWWETQNYTGNWITASQCKMAFDFFWTLFCASVSIICQIAIILTQPHRLWASQLTGNCGWHMVRRQGVRFERSSRPCLPTRSFQWTLGYQQVWYSAPPPTPSLTWKKVFPRRLKKTETVTANKTD